MIRHNPRDAVDSYTGEPFKEEYRSPIDGIQQGRSAFYKDREMKKIGEQYLVSPAAEGWSLWRRGCPRELFPRFATQEQAVRAMDWCVRNDGSVGIAIHWLGKQELDPFFRLLDYIMRAANGQQDGDETPDLGRPGIIEGGDTDGSEEAGDGATGMVAGSALYPAHNE
jgi:hypothetical protein